MNFLIEYGRLDEISLLIPKMTYLTALRFLKTCKVLWYLLTSEKGVQRILLKLREERNTFEVANYLTHGNNDMDKSFRSAVQNEKFYLVETFINFGADPSVENNSVLEMACSVSRDDVVDILLKDERVTKTNLGTSFKFSCSGNKVGLVKRFLLVEQVSNEDVFYAFYDACRTGLVQVVQILIEDNRCDVTGRENLGVHVAVEKGQLEVVKLLLNKKFQIDPTFKQNVLVRCACRNNRTDILRFLLTFETVNPNDDNNDALYTCIHYKSPDCLQILLSDSRFKVTDDALHLCVGINNMDCIQLLLADKRANPAYERNKIFRIACSRGNMNMIKLFQHDFRVNPAARHNSGFKWACIMDHRSVVKHLLKDPRLDPSDKNNRALRCANERGRIGIVKILLKDERVLKGLENKVEFGKLVKAYNKAASFPFATFYIGTYPQIKSTIKCLSVSTFDVLRLLCIAQNYYPFKRIATKTNQDLSELNNSLLCIASEKGNIRFVNRILKDKRVDPAAGNNWPIRIASWHGRDQVVERLLKYPTVNPAMPNRSCIFLASERQNKSTCAILFKCKKVLDQLSEKDKKYFEEYIK